MIIWWVFFVWNFNLNNKDRMLNYKVYKKGMVVEDVLMEVDNEFLDV